MILIYSAIFPDGLVEVSSQQQVTWIWYSFLLQLGKGLYIAGVFLLFVRFLIRLGSIIRLRFTASVKKIEGIQVYTLKEPVGPFSFFRWIFIHPESHSSGEIKEILTHELTHVRQWHSIDVVYTELISMICWINPFVWLLKREVRYNLEYLADNTVLQAGYDSRNYQYHLLGLAHHSANHGIYNNFNVLDLKNRIHMMNKRRSGSIERTKYLLFIPLTVLLMIISNIEAVARTARNLTESILPVVTNETFFSMKGHVVNPDGIPLGGTIVLSKDGKITTTTNPDGSFRIENAPANTVFSFYRPGMVRREVTLRESMDNLSIVLSGAFSKMDNPVFTIVDEMPTFPGGDMAMLTYINKSVVYPREAIEKGIQGRVVVCFVVNEDGSISKTRIVRGIDPSLDREAERVVNAMPQWNPGKKRGEEVAVMYTLPIIFRLQ